jgi:hypothetical protein
MAVCAFYAVTMAVALLPILLTDILPLADLPNHLARIYILNHLASNTTLQSYYSVHWRLLSFQSTDFILPLLAKLVGLFPAARIYVALTFLAIVGGVAALHKALFGWVGLWPAISALLLYNHLLAWGFVSYLFALGMALLMIAAWIASDDCHPLPRLVGFSLTTLALLFCHLFVFASYAVVIAGYECARAIGRSDLRWHRRIGTLIAAALPFGIPVILAFYGRDSLLKTDTLYGDGIAKLRAVVSPIAMYLTPVEICLALVSVPLLLVFVSSRYFERSKALHFPMVIVLLLALAMPNRLLDVWGTDFRLPVFLLLLLIASRTLKFRHRRHALCFGVCLIVLLAVRVGTVSRYWNYYEADFDEFRAAVSKIDGGSRVMPVMLFADRREQAAPSLIPYTQAFSFVVIDRDAFLPRQFTTSTPLGFANRGRDAMAETPTKTQTVQWRPTQPAFRAVSQATIRQAEAVGREAVALDYYSSTFDWSAWPEHYDYLVEFNFGRPDNPVPALLTEVSRGSFFSIFRIHPPP